MGAAGFVDLLQGARARSAAVGAFTCYDLVTGAAVLAAAEARETNVILLVSASAVSAPTGPGLLRGLRGLADGAAPACCLQLDHCDDLALMRSAFDAGAGAVMADGSRLDDERNAELVGEAVVLAREYEGAVEAELGHVAGDEEIAGDDGGESRRGNLTDPAHAAEFMQATDADCLAVSIGNFHGRYRRAPRLDFDRLDEIRRRVSAPLALHGASGLSDADLERLIGGGIVKVNVNQELRSGWFDAVIALSARYAPQAELLALERDLSDALRAVVDRKLNRLEPAAVADGHDKPPTAGENDG